MMLNKIIFGVRLWILLYLLFSVLLFIVVLIIFFKEKIRRTYYKIRHPEKLIKVIIHFPNNMYKVYYRLIPDNKILRIDGKIYHYNDKNIIKQNDFFVKENKEGNLVFRAGNRTYLLNDKYAIKNRFSKYMEIHYFYNNISPIDFKVSPKRSGINLSSKEMELLKENDLFSKLLTLDGEKSIMFFLLILGSINTIVSIAILGKILEWF